MAINVDKYTKKLREILTEAQNVAFINKNQFVEPCHLLYALINNDNIAKQLLAKINGNIFAAHQAVNLEIEKLNTVDGENTITEFSKSLLQVLQKAEIIMTEKDYFKVKNFNLNKLNFLKVSLEIHKKNELLKIIQKSI